MKPEVAAELQRIIDEVDVQYLVDEMSHYGNRGFVHPRPRLLSSPRGQNVQRRSDFVAWWAANMRRPEPIPRERALVPVRQWGVPLVRVVIEAQFALQRYSDTMALLHGMARVLGESVPDIPRERALVVLQ